jgi:hypothetical protein
MPDNVCAPVNFATLERSKFYIFNEGRLSPVVCWSIFAHRKSGVAWSGPDAKSKPLPEVRWR